MPTPKKTSLPSCPSCEAAPVPATPLGTPSSSSGLVPATTSYLSPSSPCNPHDIALQLTQGWHRAQAGLVEILRFGAMLLQVSEWLESTVISSRKHGKDGRFSGRSPGLRGWLSEHCPDINYNTAYGYMSAANGLRHIARLAADVPLLVLMGEDPIPEARAEKLRQRIMRTIESSTLTLLKSAATATPPSATVGGARPGAGRPPQARDAVRDAGAAWGACGMEIDKAMAWHFTRFLPAAMAREAFETITLLRDALRERLDELKQGE